MPRRARYGLLSNARHVRNLKYVERAPGGGAIGAQANVYASTPHLEQARDADRIVVE